MTPPIVAIWLMTRYGHTIYENKLLEQYLTRHGQRFNMIYASGRRKAISTGDKINAIDDNAQKTDASRAAAAGQKENGVRG